MSAGNGERRRHELQERNCGNEIRVDDKLDGLIRILRAGAFAGHCHWSYGSPRYVSGPRSDAEEAASQLIQPHCRALTERQKNYAAITQPISHANRSVLRWNGMKAGAWQCGGGAPSAHDVNLACAKLTAATAETVRSCRAAHVCGKEDVLVANKRT